MKLNLNKTGLLKCFFLFLTIALLSLLICLFQLKNIAYQVIQSEQQRHESDLIASQLRQSSDNLTLMSRLYVITGEQKYRDYYDQILAIREGTAPRPKNYDAPYWDLFIVKPIVPELEPPQSIETMMMHNHFTLEEFALLAKAKYRGEQLKQMEMDAMNLIDSPLKQQKLASLFSKEYLVAKANVMHPIAEFYNHIQARTKTQIADLEKRMTQAIIIAISLALVSTGLMLLSIFQALKSLSKAKEENDLLLLNILPESIASRLKAGEEDIADEYHQASVLFADIINFTKLTEELGPKETVILLNKFFAELDALTDLYEIEKIKTIGDNYMAVSGVPIASTQHATNIALYALAMLDRLHAFNEANKTQLQLRIGMTYGAVIAGVIGHKKFVYDVWGNVVNLASRLEGASLANKILISEKMAFMLEEQFIVTPHEELSFKGIGLVKTYFLLGKK